MTLHVSREVDPHDSMFNLNRNMDGYLATGRSALSGIQAAITVADAKSPASILDFGCGHGRVGRWLRAAYPDAELIGAELTKAAVDFYARAFQATGWKTSENLSSNDPGRKFDLIWAGSVVTHLPEHSARLLIEQFMSWLNPNGLAVFSSHGRVATRIIVDRGGPALTSPGAHIPAVEAFHRGQFGFVPLADHSDYGTSFVPSTWFINLVENAGNVRLTMLSEAGWSGNQDIIAIQNKPPRWV